MTGSLFYTRRTASVCPYQHRNPTIPRLELRKRHTQRLSRRMLPEPQPRTTPPASIPPIRNTPPVFIPPIRTTPPASIPPIRSQQRPCMRLSDGKAYNPTPGTTKTPHTARNIIHMLPDMQPIRTGNTGAAIFSASDQDHRAGHDLRSRSGILISPPYFRSGPPPAPQTTPRITSPQQASHADRGPHSSRLLARATRHRRP